MGLGSLLFHGRLRVCNGSCLFEQYFGLLQLVFPCLDITHCCAQSGLHLLAIRLSLGDIAGLVWLHCLRLTVDDFNNGRKNPGLSNGFLTCDNLLRRILAQLGCLGCECLCLNVELVLSLFCGSASEFDFKLLWVNPEFLLEFPLLQTQLLLRFFLLGVLSPDVFQPSGILVGDLPLPSRTIFFTFGNDLLSLDDFIHLFLFFLLEELACVWTLPADANIRLAHWPHLCTVRKIIGFLALRAGHYSVIAELG